MKRVAIAFILILAGASTARAELVRLEITGRGDVGTSGYEKIIATAHYAVDPRNAHDTAIADLDKAAVNADGRIEFSGDVYILRPKDPARSNGTAIVEVSNRGTKLILQHINGAPGRSDPSTDRDLGDGFLMRHGFTIVFAGWQFDVRRGTLMGAALPRATGVSGIVRADFQPNDANPAFAVADLAGYAPVDPLGIDTSLTVRDGPFGGAQSIARSRFTLQENTVTLTGGFEPGRTYTVAYRAQDPAIAGLGLAAVRDLASWIRRSPDSPVQVRFVLGYGVSQTARFLQTFVRGGFNSDERGLAAFDAVMPVGAGAASLDVNRRWATSNGNSFFDGALLEQRISDGALKVFAINSSNEYWVGGRSAALIHVSPDGTTDVDPPANVRIYTVASATHAPGPFPPRLTLGQYTSSPLGFGVLRGLLLSLDRWVKEGATPPASRYPRIADGTLVAIDRVRWPAIPGVTRPQVPAARRGTTSLPLLVPQVDEDGHDLAGIRLPEIAVPLATFTGWNPRSPSTGAPSELVPFMGAYLSLATTATARAATTDPRMSIDERYGSEDVYRARVETTIDGLIRDGYLAPEDRAPMLARSADHWRLRHAEP